MLGKDTHDKYVVPHSRQLTELQASTKSAHKRLDNLDKLTDAVNVQNTLFTKLLMTVEQQGKDLTTMVETLKRHEDKIDGIEERMETKDTVARLHGKVEELHNMMAQKDIDDANNKVNEYNDMKKFIMKILIGVGVTVIGSLVIFAIVVLTAMTRVGALPTP